MVWYAWVPGMECHHGVVTHRAGSSSSKPGVLSEGGYSRLRDPAFTPSRIVVADPRPLPWVVGTRPERRVDAGPVAKPGSGGVAGCGRHRVDWGVGGGSSCNPCGYRPGRTHRLGSGRAGPGRKPCPKAPGCSGTRRSARPPVRLAAIPALPGRSPDSECRAVQVVAPPYQSARTIGLDGLAEPGSNGLDRQPEPHFSPEQAARRAPN